MTTAEDTPKPAHSPLTGVTIGGGIALAGVIAVSSALTSSMSREGASVHGAAMFLSSIAIIVGLLVVAVVLLDWRNARRDAERARVAATRMTEVKQLLAGIEEGFGRLAAARTVDLHKVEQELQTRFSILHEQAMLGQVMIAEKFAGRLEASAHTSTRVAVDELTKRMEDIGAKVAQMQEQHLTEVAEAYELGRIVGPGDPTTTA